MVDVISQAEEIERAMASLILNDPSCFEDILEMVDESVFYTPAYKMIFLTTRHLWREKGGYDFITILDHMKGNGTLDQIGGEASLLGIQAEFMSSANVKSWCETLIEKKRLRDLDQLSRVIQSSIGDGADSKQMINDINDRLDKITGDISTGSVQTMSQVITQAYEVIKKRSETETGLTGVPTGFRLLNKATAGWQNGNYIIVAAPTKQGKSTLLLNFAMAAAKSGLKTLIFSMEMSSIELGERFISSESQVETTALHYKQQDQSMWERLMKSCNKLYNIPIILDTAPALTIVELSAKAKRLKKKEDIKFVLVDYVQLMSGCGEKSRQLQVENISRGLKKLAAELDIPVIAVSQFSRPLKGQENRRPVLSDLRDSGALEQDANVVLMIHDPDEKRKKEHLDAKGIPYQDVQMDELREIIIGANRQGPKQDILVRWIGKYFAFSDL
jgi:replicative DNA helicase